MKVSLIYAYWPNQPDGATWCDLPWALRDKGLPKKLDQAGHEVIETMLMAQEPFPDELRAGLVLASEVSDAVREAVAEGELAVVLAGSCAISAIGAIGGLNGNAAIAWLDAHPDLSTPETSTSGLLEGMALAGVSGLAWQAMIKKYAGLEATADLANTTLFGARDIEVAEQTVIGANDIVLTNDPAELSARVSGVNLPVYAHLDMDVHGGLQVRATSGVVNGGLDVAVVREALCGLPRLDCLGVTGLDPAAPDAARAADIAIDHILAVAAAPI